MLILPQTVVISWNVNNRNHFESKGYKFTKYRNKFEINVLDLQPKSQYKVRCICDYCNKEILRIYATISSDMEFNIEQKICCGKCQPKKNKEILSCKYGVTNIFQLEETKEKIKQTCLQKYGVEYSGQTIEKKEKTKSTCLEKYGTESTWQSVEIKEKIKQTNLERYGVEYPTQSVEIKERIEQTNLEKYGVKCPFQNPNIREKIKQTNLKKYGVEHHTQDQDFKNKMKQLCKDKYGVEYSLQIPEVRKKIEETNMKKYGVKSQLQLPDVRKLILPALYIQNKTVSSKQQRHINKLLNGELNYPVNNCLLDIAFLDEMIYIEYDGSGHDLQVRRNKITLEEFNQKEIKRKKFLQNRGWKLIRIISKKDYLPYDDDIIKIIEKSKYYLNNTNHSWVEIDLDNLVFKCSEFIEILNIVLYYYKGD